MVDKWFKTNKLSLNVSKTKCMLFTNKVITSPPNSYINNSKIDIVHEFKFLGTYIDDKLTWNKHISYKWNVPDIERCF